MDTKVFFKKNIDFAGSNEVFSCSTSKLDSNNYFAFIHSRYCQKIYVVPHMNQVNTDDRERCNIVSNRLDSASAVKCQFPLLLAVAGALFKL